MRLPRCYLLGMPRRRPTSWIAFVAIVLLAAAGVLAAGCGSQSSGPAALSKRAYIEQSNALQADAAAAFTRLDASWVATPARAREHIKAFDALIAGYGGLEPPARWRDEHAALVKALTTMRQSIVVISRASPTNRAVIATQLRRYDEARDEFEAAVRSINSTR